MLQKMNEYIKGWVAGVIVALIGATFVFWGLSSYVSGSSGANAAVAKVNGVKISAQTFSREYRRMKTAYQQQAGVATLSPQEEQQLKQYLSQQLVMQQTLLQSAKQQGFAISMAQVRLLLMQDPEFQVDGKFSQQKLQYAMFSGGARSVGAFFAKQQQNFLVGQVRGGILQSSFILPGELAQSYGLLNQTRDFGYFAIPVASFLASDKVSVDEIKNYYDNHQSQYKTPQLTSFDYLILDPDVVTKGIKVSPSEIQQFYDDHSANYAMPKRWQVSMATIKLAQGSDQATQKKALDTMSQLSKSLTEAADFAVLAKQHNADFSTEWLVASNNIVNVKVLESLKPGAYSTTMQTAKGLVIVRLDKVQQAKTTSLADVKDKIGSMLKSQKLEQVMSNDTEQLNNLSYTNPDTLSPAAEQLSLTIEHTELMPSSGSQSGLFADSAIIQAAFGDEVFKQGYNSNPVILKSGAVVVLRRNKVKPSSVVPLDKVSGDIRELLAHQKAEQLAGVDVYKIQQSLHKGTSPQQLAKRYQLTWVAKKQVARDNKDLPAQLLDTVFNTVLDGHNQPSYNSVLQDNKIYYVVAVNNWHNGDINNADSQQLDSLRGGLESSLAQFDYAAYVKSANEQAKVKLYPSVLNGVS